MMMKMRKINRIAAGTLAAVALSLGTVSAAEAFQPAVQDGFNERRPPKPKPAAKAPIITSTGVGLLLAGVVIFAGLMPVKRSHQD